MKRFLASVLAFGMLLTMTAFAEDDTFTSITLNNTFYTYNEDTEQF